MLHGTLTYNITFFNFKLEMSGKLMVNLTVVNCTSIGIIIKNVHKHINKNIFTAAWAFGIDEKLFLI